MSMWKAYKRTTIIAGIAVGVFATASVLFVGAAVMLSGEWTHRDGLLEELAETRSREQHAAAMRVLARETVSLRNEVETIAADHEVAAVVAALERAAEGAGVAMSIDAVTTGQAEEIDVPLLDLTMNARGSFSRLFHFTSLLETIPRAALVQSAQFSYDNDAEIWTAAMRVRVITTSETL